MKFFDVIVVGAGHNGLAAAAALADSGRKVLLLEAQDDLGGMARTVEFAPGFRASLVAHTLGQLHPDVAKALKLDLYGLSAGNKAAPTVALNPGGDNLVLSGVFGETVRGLSGGDGGAWTKFRRRLLFQAALLHRFFGEIPVQPGAAGAKQKAKLAKAAIGLRMAGREELREFLRVGLMSIADCADEALDDKTLKGLLGFDGTLGSVLGPHSPTSMFNLLCRLAAEQASPLGGLAIPQGGMGAVVDMFAQAAKAAGAEVRAGSKVGRILRDKGRAIGIVLEGGSELRAAAVLSAVHPATTFLDLVGPADLDTGFVREVRCIRTEGNVSRLNLALDKAPSFEGIDASLLAGRIVVAPTIDGIERSFNPSKYGELPDDPAFEVVVQSATDPDMAPDGAAVCSIAIQNTPYRLKQGWDAGRAAVEAAVMDKLEAVAPGVKKSVVALEFLSPADIESRCLSPGGHWHCGELRIDRAYSLRPLFGSANYRTPLDGLYICGAGTHPGGGVSGISGLNAAKAIIADGEKKRA